MPFPDFLILPLRVHQTMNVHFPEPAPAPKKRQQITACIAKHRHQDGSPVKGNMQMVFHPHHGKHHREQKLLKHHAQQTAKQKRHTAQKNIFPDIQSGYGFLPHPQQQINAKLRTSLLQHEPNHVVDQPRHDQYDKKCGESDHHSHDIHILQHIDLVCQFVLKNRLPKEYISATTIVMVRV